MPKTISSLWPSFNVDVQSPLAILRVQANQLAPATRGILQAVVETESVKERVQHRLVIIAPAYNGYRHTLIVARHSPNLFYPVEVQASGLATEKKVQSSVLNMALAERSSDAYHQAHDDDEMQELVRQSLQSGETKALVVSLIAKSNETTLPVAPDLSSDFDGAGQEAKS